MSSGPPIISAWAAIKAFLGSDKLPREDSQQAELDREELREVEYEEAGLAVPPRAAREPRRAWRWSRGRRGGGTPR
jgi:hypothetical protein